MPIQLPAVFGPEKQQRLEAVRELLVPLEEQRDRLSAAKRTLGKEEEKRATIETEIDRLDAEMETLKLEEKQLEIIEEFSKELEAKLQPVLVLGSALIETLPGPMAEVIAAFSAASLEMWEQLDGTHLRYRRLVAQQRMNAFKAYRDAGFPLDQAFRLVEADAQAASPLEHLRDFKINFKA